MSEGEKARGAPEELTEAADWLRRALAAPDLTPADASAAARYLASVLLERPDLRQPGDPP